MRRALAAVVGFAGLVACSRDDVAKSSPPPPKSAAPPASASAVAPGAGDRSGTSIANAKALVRGTPTTFTVPCTGAAVYVGPFTLAHDPQKLVLQAEVKGTGKGQVCTPDGQFVDAKDQSPRVAGLPCVEEGKAQAVKLEYEYSPGNGGNAANPVYWRVKQESAKPAGCETVTVTLTHP